MTLFDAPFQSPLTIVSLQGLNEEERLVLENLGLEVGERVFKKHTAPLGDPLSVLVGNHVFTLRREISRKIEVAQL